jgi:hypothetical protein
VPGTVFVSRVAAGSTRSRRAGDGGVVRGGAGAADADDRAGARAENGEGLSGAR